MIHKIFLFALVSVFAAGVLALLVQIFVVAPYGRHSRHGWGPDLPPRLPWVLAGLGAVGVMGALYVHSGRGISDPALIFLSLWILAYVYRGGVYPWAIRKTGRRTPALVSLGGFVLVSAAAFINGYFLFSLPLAFRWTDFVTLRGVIGLALFFGGFLIHLWSDRILAELRRTPDQDYQIPRRGLFRLVSSPNYLGAIVQWAGWAVLAWNLAALAPAWFTFAFLLPRAVANHRWYKRSFADYPRTRRALIPFVL